jgi:hypothetical protein
VKGWAIPVCLDETVSLKQHDSIALLQYNTTQKRHQFILNKTHRCKLLPGTDCCGIFILLSIALMRLKLEDL